MILSALRVGEEPSVFRNQYSDFLCADTDYATAELIGNKLILHMAQAYQLIKGSEKVSIPTVKPLDQKQILLSLLPEEFGHSLLVKEAASQGISHRTSTRWTDEWMAQGLVYKIRHGVYRKLSACA